MIAHRDVPRAPDPLPYASMRSQAGGVGMRPSQGWRLVIALLASPVAWVVHLLGVYLVLAMWCAERWPGVGVAIGVLTVACLAASGAAAALALRLWRRGQTRLLDDAEPGEPEAWDARMGERSARMSFLAVVALFMAVLFAFLILLQGMPPLFAQPCPATTVP